MSSEVSGPNHPPCLNKKLGNLEQLHTFRNSNVHHAARNPRGSFCHPSVTQTFPKLTSLGKQENTVDEYLHHPEGIATPSNTAQQTYMFEGPYN